MKRRCAEIQPYDLERSYGGTDAEHAAIARIAAERHLRCMRELGHDGRCCWLDSRGYRHEWIAEPAVYFTTVP